MSELQTLIAKQDELLAQIKTIESNTDEEEIGEILQAIKNQRWYFFKNKTKVIMDRDTGLLWVNLNYYNIFTDDHRFHDKNEDRSVVEKYDFDGYTGWHLPTMIESTRLYKSESGKKTEIFPFFAGIHDKLKEIDSDYRNLYKLDMLYEYLCDYISLFKYLWLPCTNILVKNTDYEQNVSPNNNIYKENERLQFTLDLFVKNKLCPIFEDDTITQRYKQIYLDRPELLEQLQKIQPKIKSLQAVTLLSSDFDYTALLAKYDVKAIDKSIIKYYQSVHKWSNELLDKLDYFEQKKESVIRDFNLISLKLSKKYEDNPNFTDKENALLSDRQRYFQKRFSLGMNSVKAKIVAVKKQADDLEYRIDDIDNGNDSIHALALLEKEERASFELVAENTAKIIKNALLKIEYFQDNHQFVMNAIDIWAKWSENYCVFKTTYRENLKTSCENDSIEEDIWSKWYKNWQDIRFAIEQKLQPIIERGLKSSIPTITETKISVPELLIAALDDYKKSIDKFYMEDRKGIYQKFVFQAGGDLQDKFESESALYKCTISLQTALQDIIFNCKNAEDRIFILKWANNLLDIQIDEILSFVADNDLQKISQTILTEFATLKQKNYDVYLADAKAYGEEKSRREKEYNSLIFKMRKDLMKQ